MCCFFYLFQQVTELECVSSQANAVHTHKTELNQTIQELESTLKKKEEVCANIYSGFSARSFLKVFNTKLVMAGKYCIISYRCHEVKFFSASLKWLVFFRVYNYISPI